jgi:hypothetical protein
MAMSQCAGSCHAWERAKDYDRLSATTVGLPTFALVKNIEAAKAAYERS